MRIKIQKKGYTGNLTIDESQFKRFERKGWKKVPVKAKKQSEAPVADAEDKIEQS